MSKKVLALLLAVIGSIYMSFSSVFAYNSSEEPVTFLKGSEISTDFQHELTELGIRVNGMTTIELVSALNQTRSTNINALVVTNTDKAMVYKDVLLFVDKEGTSGIDDLRAITPRASSTVPYSYKNFVIKGTAKYKRYAKGTNASYVQPQGVSFVLNVNGDTYPSYVEVEYSAVGHKFSLPDFTLIGSNDLEDMDEYYITAYEYDPEENTTYGKSRQYDTGAVIYVDGLLEYHCLTFTYTYYNSNNTPKTESYSIRLS